MAIRTLYLPSVPLYLKLHPLYLCHQTKGIRYTTRTLCMTWQTIHVTSYSVCMLSEQLFGHYTPLCITSHPVYLWHHIQHVRYHHTAFMKTQWLYRTSHPPYLTSQPLYLCHHTDGTHICIDVSLYLCHHNKWVSHHTWHTHDIILNLHPITFTLYDMNYHVLCHHIHGIHDIRSSLYDIISAL